jgi:hypothetical protein
VGGALIAAFCALRLAGVVSGRIDPEDLLPEADA